MQKKKEKGGINDALLEKERDQLANALERLADVQRELAEGQRSLMTGHRALPCNYFHSPFLPGIMHCTVPFKCSIGSVSPGMHYIFPKYIHSQCLVGHDVMYFPP